MSWRDSYSEHHDDDPMRRFGRPGGDWQGLRPSIDNPLTWAIPLGTVSGITVRIHLIFVLFIVIELLRSLGYPSQGDRLPTALSITAISMAALFVIVLAHEFGHCLACRWTGGAANEILMWPLGGLAYCLPPNRWKAHLITVVGGPLVNVAICLIAGTALAISTGYIWEVAIPNPLHPFAPMSSAAQFTYPKVTSSLPIMVLFIINAISMILLLFNLLPIFPLDGGRIVQAVAWSKLGYTRSMRVAIRTGYVGAILLCIYGAVMSQWMIVGIAVFGAVICYLTHRQLAYTDEMLGFESDEYQLSAAYGDDDPTAEITATTKLSRAERRAERERERIAHQEEEEAKQLDQILQKIADGGMESISATEREILERATERRRKQQQASPPSRTT